MFGMKLRLASLGLLFVTAITFSAQSTERVRIDSSSDAAVQKSYGRMMKTLSPRKQEALAIAILQINLEGVNSVYERIADPTLDSFGAERIKDKIAGMTADEIIAHGKKVSTVKIEVNRP